MLFRSMIVLRNLPMRMSNFADLAELARMQLAILKEAEARLGPPGLATPEQWTKVSEAADFLAEICTAQEEWLADHDRALAVEAEAIRAAIGEFDLPAPITGGSEAS